MVSGSNTFGNVLDIAVASLRISIENKFELLGTIFE